MSEQRRAERLDQPREPRGVKLPRFDAEAFGRWSEGIARGMGTANFIVYMTVVIAAWFVWNTLAPASLRFDPYTFTFLTLVLSLQASYAAPLILLAQNRQTDRDRVGMEEDRRRATMQKADTEYLAREVAALRIALGEVATRDFLRSELARLAEELDEATQRRQRLERGQQDKPAPHRAGEPRARGERRGRGEHRGSREARGADETAEARQTREAREALKAGEPPGAGEPLDEPIDELDGDFAQDGRPEGPAPGKPDGPDRER